MDLTSTTSDVAILGMATVLDVKFKNEVQAWVCKLVGNPNKKATHLNQMTSEWASRLHRASSALGPATSSKICFGAFVPTTL